MSGDRPRASEVKAVYERIGPHFARTRASPWRDVKQFVEGSSRVERGLDIGCGNGRHTALLTDTADTVVGLDVSRALLETARERAWSDGWTAQFLCGDAAALPIQTDTIDLAVYIATVHHLSSRAARVRSLDELARVLRSGGSALVSAWSTTHDRFDADDRSTGFDTTVDWTLPNETVVPRFYHIYAPEEFAADLSASKLTIDRTFQSKGNCYGVVRG